VPVTLGRGEELYNTGIQYVAPTEHIGPLSTQPFTHNPKLSYQAAASSAEGDINSQTLTLEPEDVERWIAAAPLIKEFFRYEFPEDNVKMRMTKASDWPTLSILRDEDRRGKWTWWVFVLAGILYGGMHALAWHSHFRSKAEHNMWLFSVVVIMIFGVLVSWTWFSFAAESLTKWEDKQESEDNGMRFKIWAVFVTPAFVLYVLSRAYLIVESFLALFHPVPGIFDLPEWTTFIPHIA
jgi:hypothetical protein